jgi:hypothetical protein
VINRTTRRRSRQPAESGTLTGGSMGWKQCNSRSPFISLHIVVITGDLERDLKDVFAILRTGDHSEAYMC